LSVGIEDTQDLIADLSNGLGLLQVRKTGR